VRRFIDSTVARYVESAEMEKSNQYAPPHLKSHHPSELSGDIDDPENSLLSQFRSCTLESMKRFACPMPGCNRKVKFIRAECEEVPVPRGQKMSRKPPFGLQRVFLVQCPEHGRKYALQMGHHVSMGKLATDWPSETKAN